MGHTLNNLHESSLYKSLDNAKEQVNSIINKIKAVEDSLSRASGIEIDKMTEDLYNVKAEFNKIKNAVDGYSTILNDRAKLYDSYYDHYKSLCDSKHVISKQDLGRSNMRYTIVVCFQSISDNYETKKLYYNNATYGEDGVICVVLATEYRKVARVNQNSISLENVWDAAMQETDVLEERTTYTNSFVFEDGNCYVYNGPQISAAN